MLMYKRGKGLVTPLFPSHPYLVVSKYTIPLSLIQCFNLAESGMSQDEATYKQLMAILSGPSYELLTYFS